MDWGYFAYLLLIIPGFCLVWTFRHFTTKNPINDFEYAIWSFLWGVFLFFLSIEFGAGKETIFDLNEPFKLLGTSMGVGIAMAIFLAFPLGYVGALLFHRGLFNWLNKQLNNLIR